MCVGDRELLAPQPGCTPRVLVFEAWSPCPAQPCSGLDGGPPQPTPHLGPSQTWLWGPRAGPSGCQHSCWTLWERHQARCPGAPCRAEQRATALLPPTAPVFPRAVHPSSPFPQKAPLHTTALFWPPGPGWQTPRTEGAVGAEGASEGAPAGREGQLSLRRRSAPPSSCCLLTYAGFGA